MPKRTDIRSILISSAGLIVIAQERPDVPLLTTLSATTTAVAAIRALANPPDLSTRLTPERK